VDTATTVRSCHGRTWRGFDEAGEVVARIRTLLENGEVTAVSGKRIQLFPDTLCLHSDTPRALELARAIAAAMKDEKCSMLNTQ
jgi:lactam utilization protein B